MPFHICSLNEAKSNLMLIVRSGFIHVEMNIAAFVTQVTQVFYMEMLFLLTGCD